MGNAKRKWRWSSKSLLGSKAPSKVIVLDHVQFHMHDGAGDHSALDVSLDGCDTEDGKPRTRVAAKMRRNGSRLLSIVGWQSSSGARFTKKSSNALGERDAASALTKDAVSAPVSTIQPGNAFCTPKPSSPSSEKTGSVYLVRESSTPRRPSLVETEVGHIAIADRPKLLHRLSQSQLNSVATLTSPTESLGLKPSRSNCSFAHQLSHKLSSTFGNPTIVHRPNLRTRPALLSMREDPQIVPGIQSNQELSPASTAPSSFNYSSSVSAGELSTGKTSLESNVTSLHSVISLDPNDKTNDPALITTAREIAREKPLTPIQEAPLIITPTIITVETTANAKIFFETFFNSLLAGQASPRSLRRNDLETRLKSQSVPEEQRQQERSTWAAIESEHLRHSRVLKGKTNQMCKGSGIAIAGYEVLRILGKGSFGVVRLVREKDTPPESPYSVGSAPPTIPVRKSASREESTSLRTTAIEALRATLEGQRLSQKRSLEGPRKAVYAMKVIRKSDMLRNCQEGHLRAERDFLVASENSRWVVPLMASFQDITNLYLVMEYMVGGDFLGLLFRKDILKERHARWYIAEMILCVEESHRLRWIHRDVKPDNFLISASGHLKISDFGLAFDGHWAHDQRYFKNHRQSLMEKLGIEAKGDLQDQEEDASKDAKAKLANILTGRKGRHDNEKAQLDGPSENESILQWRNRHGKRRLAMSVVGTSQYMAPEVIRGDPYDGRCDWWSVGIILFECLYGFTPFVCDRREETKEKILNNAKTLIFPDEREVDRKEKVSFDAMELINSLLQEKEHRLCSKKYRLNDFQHSKRTPGQLIARRADPLAQDYQGNYVYPDDAADLKAHRFFRRISWDRLHLTRPPFVPDVSGHEDTKYFDEDEPISDVDDAASHSEFAGSSDQGMPDAVPKTVTVTQVDGAPCHEVTLGGLAHGASLNGNNGPKGAGKFKERKRPRDKVLRDREVGRKALDIRKQGAFAGYTYRRPQLYSFEEEHGRQRTARRSLLPSFD